MADEIKLQAENQSHTKRWDEIFRKPQKEKTGDEIFKETVEKYGLIITKGD